MSHPALGTKADFPPMDYHEMKIKGRLQENMMALAQSMIKLHLQVKESGNPYQAADQGFIIADLVNKCVNAAYSDIYVYMGENKL